MFITVYLLSSQMKLIRDQWSFPRAMAMWAVYMLQKSSWDKLQGERFCDSMGILGGDGLRVIGVTTLGSNGELVVSRA
jgi:hypothetical protein